MPERVRVCLLGLRRGKSNMPLQTYKGYTVDYRLRQFRKVYPGDCVCGGGEIEFIDFRSEEGDAILVEMIREGLVPDDKLNYILFLLRHRNG